MAIATFFIFAMIRLVVIVGLCVFGIIKGVQFLRKNKFFGKTRTIILSISLILLVAALWIFNMGWFRVILTWMLVPVIHAVVFFFINLNSAKYFENSKKLKLLNIFFILTYVMSYLLFPDFGDVGGMYFFFGMVRSDALSNIAFLSSVILFIVHIVLLFMQIAEIHKVKKSMTDNH